MHLWIEMVLWVLLGTAEFTSRFAGVGAVRENPT
jgi:hypothetical protein